MGLIFFLTACTVISMGALAGCVSSLVMIDNKELRINVVAGALLALSVLMISVLPAAYLSGKADAVKSMVPVAQHFYEEGHTDATNGKPNKYRATKSEKLPEENDKNKE
jgi:hypothetical protein